MGDDWQSADEIEAHFADGGPLVAARRWLTTVVTVRDLDAAWLDVDPEFRLLLARRWLWASREDGEVAAYDLDEAALGLAEEYPVHDLWPAFSETILDDLGSSWPLLDLDSLAAASRPRPIAIGYELVVLAAAGPQGSIVNLEEPTPLEETLELLMHHADDRWLVSGIGSDELPAAGWPPEA
jgi:hypothetical protein